MTSKVNAVLIFSAKNQNNPEILMPKEIKDQANRLVKSGMYSMQAIAIASACAVYADHVTAALQAEIDALKAQRDSKQAAFEAQADIVGRLLHALHSTTEADGLLVIAGLNARLNRLQAGYARYEKLRRLNVVQFQALYAESIKTGTPFDDLVDALGGAK